MSKDAYYFPHDSNARHDPKVIAMISVYGMQGYGWYWTIIEIFREQKDYKYLKTKYAINSLAKEMQCDVEKAEAFITDCILEFELINVDEEGFWSESLNKRMQPLDSRREQAKAAAAVRWGNKKKEEVEEEPIEEKPSKPIPPEKVKSLDVLTEDVLFATLLAQMWDTEQFKGVPKSVLMNERDRCVDWLRSKNKRYKDYRAFFRNWMRNVTDFNNNKKTPSGMVF